jgi:hypothetical protein
MPSPIVGMPHLPEAANAKSHYSSPRQLMSYAAGQAQDRRSKFVPVVYVTRMVPYYQETEL